MQLANRIRYRALGYPPATDYFTMNNDTGTISLTGPVAADFNSNRVYTVSVITLLLHSIQIMITKDLSEAFNEMFHIVDPHLEHS